ncbi:MAG: (d)CMP kinase [Flavobacteriia bacterium]|nr:(d)CMP kinase [Flavobacteriia bacterium]
MTGNITVAIDGHSSTGKSTLAKAIAKKFGFLYVDSGAMYRAATLQAMRMNLLGTGTPLENNSDGVQSLLNQLKIDFYIANDGANRTLLNGEDVEDEIRSMEVSSRVSAVSKISEIRKALVDQQRQISEGSNVVMDGRDIGTVVFPNADLKIFMTASDEVRSKRRYEELKAKGDEVTLEEVRTNLIERDRIDSQRADSPLVQADDAILLDNSNLTREEQFDKVVGWVEEKLEG